MKRWPIHEIFFWDKAPFFRLLLPLMAGILFYTINYRNVSFIAVIAVLFFGLYIITAQQKKHTPWIKAAHFTTLYVCIAAMAWLLCFINDIRNNKNWFANIPAQQYVAVLTTDPVEKEKTWKLEVNVIGALKDSVCHTKGKALVYMYKGKLQPLFHEGDTVLLPGDWQRITTGGNPFEFDYPRYCALNNIFYRQFVALDNIVLSGQMNYLNLPASKRIHKWCMQQLSKYITDTTVLGLMQAMLIGDEANLDPELRQSYAETGIIHIIAISGSHITFFFFIISFLLGWIKHNRWKWLKYCAAIPLIWIYVLVSGSAPSAVRAAVMFSVLAIGFAFQKQPNSLNQLLATAFFLLIAEPNWLYAIGFQLSCIAVLSLVIFYKPIYSLYKPSSKIGKGIWGAITASIAAEILVAPLVVYYFHLFPVMFVPANVAAYIFMGLVLIAGICLIAVSAFTQVAQFCGLILIAIVKFFNWLVSGMQDWNPEALRFLQINFTELVLLFIAIIGFAVFLLQKKKEGLFTGLIAVTVFLCTSGYSEWKALHQQKLIVYNISRGNHIELISGGYNHVLYTDSAIKLENKFYVTKPAHTGYRAWRKCLRKGQIELLLVNGKTVLILNEPRQQPNKVHVDYVILNYNPGEANPMEIQQTYHPKQIVIGNKASRREIAEWVEVCNRRGISLYAVSEKGAFVL